MRDEERLSGRNDVRDVDVNQPRPLIRNVGQLLPHRAACNADGFPSPDETAIAKAYCNQAGFEIANEAMQVPGGLGYSQESLVEYCMRRCRGWIIAGGSIEILENRIAEGVFEPTFSQRAGRGEP